MKQHRRAARAFTLIELLVVIAIIAILMAATMPLLPALQDESRVGTCKARLAQVGIALRLYVEDHRSYPRTLEELLERRYLDSTEVVRCCKTGALFTYRRPSLTTLPESIVAECCPPETPAGKRPHRYRNGSVRLRLNGTTSVVEVPGATTK